MKTRVKNFLKSGYRGLQRQVVKPCLLPLFFTRSRRREASQNNILKSINVSEGHAKSVRPRARIWFHAASVGELESIWPLIFCYAKRKDELILTILSESAKKPLDRLVLTLIEMKAKVIFSGYAPWEGEWAKAIQDSKPTLFVTAKYEAWPDLWISLREAGIPLAIVSAHARRSLRVAKKFCQFLEGGLPKLLFFPCLDSEVRGLRTLFPGSQVLVAGEPRWDRVYSRAKNGNSRSKELINAFQNLQRPWGVIGSAWIEDLRFLGSLYSQSTGTLWVVPHRVDEKNLAPIEKFLTNLGRKYVKTSAFSPRDLEKVNCVLVDEMGFLSELYSEADWAFVGGGFGVGIHSTIEPAIHGIPIAVGPNGTERFSEVQELSRTGQLRVLRTKQDLLEWIDFLRVPAPQRKRIWKEEAKGRLGATQKIFDALEKIHSA